MTSSSQIDDVPRALDLYVKAIPNQTYNYRIGIPSVYNIDSVNWMINGASETAHLFGGFRPVDGTQVIVAEPQPSFGLYIRLSVKSIVPVKWIGVPIDWYRIPKVVELENQEYLVANSMYADEWFYGFFFKKSPRASNSEHYSYLKLSLIPGLDLRPNSFCNLPYRELSVKDLEPDPTSFFHVASPLVLQEISDCTQNLFLQSNTSQYPNESINGVQNFYEPSNNVQYPDLSTISSVFSPDSNQPSNNSQFSNQSTYVTELSSVAVEDRSFSCSLCSSRFKDGRALKKHQLVHQDQRPFKCTVCNLAFKEKYRLLLHQVVHRDERPWKCEVCDQTFKRKNGLQHHKVLHENKPKHLCDKCGKGYSRQCRLRVHQVKKHGLAIETSIVDHPSHSTVDQPSISTFGDKQQSFYAPDFEQPFDAKSDLYQAPAPTSEYQESLFATPKFGQPPVFHSTLNDYPARTFGDAGKSFPTSDYDHALASPSGLNNSMALTSENEQSLFSASVHHKPLISFPTLKAFLSSK